MGWFLEISCIASTLACISTPTVVNPIALPRWFETRAECNLAAENIAKLWHPGSAAWRFRCVPLNTNG